MQEDAFFPVLCIHLRQAVEKEKKSVTQIFKFKLLYCDSKPWTIRKLQIAMMKRKATDIHFFYQQLKI